MEQQISELISTPLTYKIQRGRIVMSPEEFEKALKLIKETSNGAFQRERDEAHMYVIRELTELRIQLSESLLNKGDSYSLAVIMDATSRYYQIPVEEIKGLHRKREKVIARQTFMYVASGLRDEHKESLVSIGKFCGGRDHSTVIHSNNTIDNFMRGLTADDDVIKAVRTIKKRVELQAQVLTLVRLREFIEDIKKGDQFIYQGILYEIMQHAANGHAHCKPVNNKNNPYITIPYTELFELINVLHLAKENGISEVLMIPEKQKMLLYRTSGLNKGVRISQNKYVAGGAHPLWPDLTYLINIGFMNKTEPIEQYNDACLYYLTSNGLKAAELLKYIESGEAKDH